MIKKNKRQFLLIFKLLGFIFVAFAFCSFINQVILNWKILTSQKINFVYSWGFLAFFFNCISYLCITFVWKYLLNNFKETNKRISFFECISIYNSSQLTKYMPGKFWGIFLQAYWLEKYGINKSTTFYFNILISIFTLIYSLSFGILFSLICLKFNSFIAFLIWILFIIFFIVFISKSKIFCFSNTLKQVINIFGKKIHIFKIDKNIFLTINFFILISVIFSGLSGFASILMLRGEFNYEFFLLVSSAIIFSEAIGFLFFISPGGLGIREFILFKMLNIIGADLYSLFAPIAIRLINLFSDLVLGFFAFFIYYFHKKLK